MTDIGWVDWVFIGILMLSVVVGLIRGFVFEVLSLLGWLVAYFAAQWLSPELAPHIPVGKPGSGLNHAASFACTFIAALIIWALLSRLIRMLIQATPLSIVDRTLGATFGVARALVVMLAITTVVLLTSLAKSAAWQESRGAVWLHGALVGIKPVLPQQIAEHLPR
ncbi:CvpA family protein [Piscinibacter terrae]|uniref:CvpA family protein n=1 Tax=Piscinibacter terrae TaxID=2496871 RepID=A0A3N7HW91_9BURK|nr:CvpA family protein [Albitalea terrae]RQP25666.1 CvpA family protein [Albitalea terrae]